MAILSSSYKKVLVLVGVHQEVAWGGVSVLLLLLEGKTVVEERGVVDEVGRAELDEVFDVCFEVVELDLEVDFDFEEEVEVDLDLEVEEDVDLGLEVELEREVVVLAVQTAALEREVAMDEDKEDERDE